MAAHDSVQHKGKLFLLFLVIKWIFFCWTKLLLFVELNYDFPFPFSFLASVCGAAVTSPGYPEPGEPPVSAGPVIHASICAAKVAAVYPVQDGSGGDSVVWGRLTVLPNVTVVPPGSVRALRPTSVIAHWLPADKRTIIYIQIIITKHVK